MIEKTKRVARGFDMQIPVDSDVVDVPKDSAFQAVREALLRAKRLMSLRPRLPRDEDFDICLDLREVCALIRFAVERGIDADPPAINGAILKYRELKALTKSSPDYAIVQAELAEHYGRLCSKTYEQNSVNGRTVRDSEIFGSRILTGIAVWFMFYFLMAWFPGLLALTISNTSPIQDYLTFLTELSPFFWGGAGAAVFLLKSLSELAGRSQLDSRRLQGVHTRLFLGGAMGFATVKLFGAMEWLPGTTLQDFGAVPLRTLSEAGVAFLAGLGTKAVYALLESMIEGVHSRVATRPQ